MKTTDITDPLFLQAVQTIDAGTTAALQHLIQLHPQLVTERLQLSGPGYFTDPYLLWFVAGNPVRNEKLPATIGVITRELIGAVQQYAPGSFPAQADYTLGLVATGRVPRDCGVQIELMDILIDAGATLCQPHAALANENIAAARHLIKRGAGLTLAAAVCLDLTVEAAALLPDAGTADRELALVAAAFYGKPAMVQLLLETGVDINAYPNSSSGFHTHATALHQAVASGSLETVQLLVSAGADLHATDKIYNGTPAKWASHLQTTTADINLQKKYAAIEIWLS